LLWQQSRALRQQLPVPAISEQQQPWNPADPRNRERTRQLRMELRALLMEWDPISVAGVAAAWDEYDCLLSPVMHRLHGGISVHELAEFLDHELAEHFGLGQADESRQRAVAARMVDWWTSRTGVKPPEAGASRSVAPHR